MKIYRSKISWPLLLFVQLIFVYILYEFLSEGVDWHSFLAVFFFSMVSFTFLFIFYIFFSIHYIIDFDKKELEVKLGIFKYSKISIPNIFKIEKTRSIISSPAPSMDRIEVFYNRFSSIILSPKDKQLFIQDLKQINPKIEVKGLSEENKNVQSKLSSNK